jgi:hypothetical protein
MRETEMDWNIGHSEEERSSIPALYWQREQTTANGKYFWDMRPVSKEEFERQRATRDRLWADPVT